MEESRTCLHRGSGPSLVQWIFPTAKTTTNTIHISRMYSSAEPHIVLPWSVERPKTLPFKTKKQFANADESALINLRNQQRTPWPPKQTSTISNSSFSLTSFVNFMVCRANSLVGVRMRALAPDLAWGAFSFSNMGTKKAAVLPLPVLAMATISLPSRITGTVWGGGEKGKMNGL